MSNRSEEIRTFLIQHLEDHPHDIIHFTSEHFGVSRQLTGRYLHRLVTEGMVTATGNTRAREYALPIIHERRLVFKLAGLEEDSIWSNSVKPLLAGTPNTVQSICAFGFTEMLNNAIEHSEGSIAYIVVRYTLGLIHMQIHDDGVGIFNKIQQARNLPDRRHAILELAKGKFTTDPSRHSGEGIFFTSRMFDQFAISSGDLDFVSGQEQSDALLQAQAEPITKGTSVMMQISPFTQQTTKAVFDQYVTDQDDYGFTKTIIPIALARFGEDTLISRSQAKRIVAGLDQFLEVWLDFADVTTIGQAFADEIFRVFQRTHPTIRLMAINTTKEVQQMINRAVHREERPIPPPPPTDSKQS